MFLGGEFGKNKILFIGSPVLRGNTFVKKKLLEHVMKLDLWNLRTSFKYHSVRGMGEFQIKRTSSSEM